MNDPQVEALEYSFVVLGGGHDFSTTAPWEGSLGDFDCRLVDGRLEARPRQHYPIAEGAMQALDPHLRAWELRAELEDGVRAQFKYDFARVVDRQPTPGVVTAQAHIAHEQELTGTAMVIKVHPTYPRPPAKRVASSALVEELLEPVRELGERQQRMLVAACLVLTLLEYEHGGRARAAAALNVSRKVLGKLGRLTAKNDPSERRKIVSPVDPLTDRERAWILAVLPNLVFRAAEAAAGSAPTRLDMSDLPPL